MELIDKTIQDVRAFLKEIPSRRIAIPTVSWPVGGPRNIILNDDCGLELGHPKDESLACVLWSEDVDTVQDGRVTLIGPDFSASGGENLPFAKIVLVGVEGFTVDNTYDRCMELDQLRFDVDLEGFTLKAASQYQREWCRISREALNGGFSAGHLAASLMRMLKSVPYVRSAEIVLMTSSPADIRRLRQIVNPAVRLIAAMNKMASELELDCTECEFEDVCSEADDLRTMRNRVMQRTD